MLLLRLLLTPLAYMFIYGSLYLYADHTQALLLRNRMYNYHKAFRIHTGTAKN